MRAPAAVVPPVPTHNPGPPALAATRRAATLPCALLAACAHSPPRAAGSPGPAPAPSTATLTWLGVAGWQLRSDAGTLLVDPYVTRAAVDEMPPGAPLEPDARTVADYVPPRADAVLVDRSHYDHLLDVHAFARRTGARVVGTESTANVLRAAQLPASQIVVARGGERARGVEPYSGARR